ncbi:MAG: hypothetical protein QXO15_05470 [Nitrososphaerota archaeon]
MHESLTFKYVDEILEVAGLRRPKEIKERLNEIIRMPISELNSLVDDLLERTRNYYGKNLEPILSKLANIKGTKAYYYGAMTPLNCGVELPPDWFLRKASFYCDKIILENWLEPCLLIRENYTEKFDKDLIRSLLDFAIYGLWMERGVVEILPHPLFIKGISNSAQLITKIADEDYGIESKDPKSPYLKHEDINLEGEALIDAYIKYAAKLFSKDFIEKEGGLKKYVLKTLIYVESVGISSAVFGSTLSGSNPVTDLKRCWRLLGYWASRRAEGLVKSKSIGENKVSNIRPYSAGKLVKSESIPKDRWDEMMEGAKAEMAWISTEIPELGFVADLPVERILEIRDSFKYSFNAFREDLGKAVDEIEISKEESREDLKKVAERELDNVRRNVRDLKNDFNAIGETLGAIITFSTMTMVLGITPFSWGNLLSAWGIPILGYVIQSQRLKRRSSYFLLRLEEERETLEYLRKRGVSSLWQL